MTAPTVTEIIPASAAVCHDPFIDDLTAARHPITAAPRGAQANSAPPTHGQRR
jgi:hypothetical protein